MEQPVQSTTTPPAAGQPANPPFKFKLRQLLQIMASGESGECIARSEHAAAEPQYMLRYKAADGRATEQWWTERALAAVGGISGDDLVDKLTSWISKPLAQSGEAAQHFAYLSGDAQPIKLEDGDRRFSVAHASRSAPLCKDCRHSVELRDGRLYCIHPSQPISPVSGHSASRCAYARSDENAALMGLTRCGPEGALFEPVSPAA